MENQDSNVVDVVDVIVEPYYPNHDEFGQWDIIFEEHIYPKVTGIFDLLKIQALNRDWKETVGNRINKKQNIDWSQFERYCCKPLLSCKIHHDSLDAMKQCEKCSWTVRWRGRALCRGIDFLVNTHGGTLKNAMYGSWLDRDDFSWKC